MDGLGESTVCVLCAPRFARSYVNDCSVTSGFCRTWES